MSVDVMRISLEMLLGLFAVECGSLASKSSVASSFPSESAGTAKRVRASQMLPGAGGN
jgi:hypothetical protein